MALIPTPGRTPMVAFCWARERPSPASAGGTARDTYPSSAWHFVHASVFAGLGDGCRRIGERAVSAAAQEATGSSPPSSATPGSRISAPLPTTANRGQLAVRKGPPDAGRKRPHRRLCCPPRHSAVDDVVIGAHSTLTECIVGDGVHVPAHADTNRCAIVPPGAHGTDRRAQSR